MGRYEKPKQRRNQVPLGLILTILLSIALLAIIGTVLLHACAPKEEIQSNTPLETIAPVIEVSTEEATEEITEATTEAATEPTEEPTEEVTEAATEAATEPSTEATVPVTEPPTDEVKAIGQQLADLAEAQIGKPYAYGGTGPDEFDSSGFVFYCVKEITGTSLPHITSMQAEKGARVEKQDLLPGDVVFFWTSEPDSVEYEGIYIGDGKFVAARNPENPVSQMDLNSAYFTERYLFACRYW